MSHFAVAVFSNDGDFDSLLAPYNENDRNYYVFEPFPYEKISERFERFKKQNPKWTLEKYIKEFRFFQKDGAPACFSGPSTKIRALHGTGFPASAAFSKPRRGKSAGKANTRA